MCGIAGVLGKSEGAEALIHRIAHRGPDGIRIEAVGDHVLAHARLSVIDLNSGWQPLRAAGSTIVGNGEIYNYRELTEQFNLSGLLSTGSDFEPLLHIYATEGERAFTYLRGMYAFCLVGVDGRTWIVRDPFGIKPLYVRRAGSDVEFASEPKAFGKARVVPEILEQTLGLHYSLGQSTPWADVTRVLPGEICEFKEGQLLTQGRRPALVQDVRRIRDEEEALGELDKVLEDSVQVHQRADVPYGLFLSGGIDSSVIAAMMARLNERPVVAYTCGFDRKLQRDERSQAERVATSLKFDWVEVEFGEKDFWEFAPEAAWAMDDPVADYACLPTLKLAKEARSRLTVVLTGEGGDELFAGYGRYRRSLRPFWLGGRKSEPQIAPMVPGASSTLERWRAEAKPPFAMSSLQEAQWGDISTWLPSDLLAKADRCLMAFGLEGRTPFLDPEVAKFAFSLPDKFKVRGRFGKYLLRRWLDKHCPSAEPWSKKRGFTVPVADWIAPRAQDLANALPNVSSVRSVLSKENVQAVFRDDRHSAVRWPLVFLGLWGLIHVDGVDRKSAVGALLN